MILKGEHALRIAGFEINALNFSRVLPIPLDSTRIVGPGTTIHDLSGEPLFLRIPLEVGHRSVAFADIAVNDVFPEPLLAIHLDDEWDEHAVLRRAERAFREKKPESVFDQVHFVAYSYPKLAVQFLREGNEVAMLELTSWHEVPAPTKRDRGEPPGSFERWSLVEETPDSNRQKHAGSFEESIGIWSHLGLTRIDPLSISMTVIPQACTVPKPTASREVRYGPHDADHQTCHELRCQQTSKWCVAASVEMILNFYRWRYSQPAIANELGLGTFETPRCLPGGQEFKVVSTLEKLSRESLEAAMIATPDWNVYRREINADRPLISFIGGHSRTVAGFTESSIALPTEIHRRGLIVFDPRPSTHCDLSDAGARPTLWENFRAHTHYYAFTAEPRHI